MALLFTFITGVFFLLGIILNLFLKNKKEVSILAIALAFVVLVNLIFFDILPEAVEDISFIKVLFVLLGFFLLKIMDAFVPHHDHNHQELNDNENEHHHHLEHIGIITILALSLHNVIECMALYNITLNNFRSGLLMCLAIGLHNIPLGLQIGSSLKKRKITYISLLVLSGVAGGLISMVIGKIPEIYISYILCFTLGMLLYLTICELFKELLVQIKNIYSLYGIIIGIVLVIITSII